MIKLKVIKIEKFSTSNGIGLRNVLWVSGCRNHCKGCHNPESWDFNYGDDYNESHYTSLTKEFKSDIDILDGITLLGGEPFDELNVETLVEIASKFKQEYPNKTIWAWTGYLFEDIMKNQKQYELLKLVDVLIDGPFNINLLDLRLKYRGSSNQRVIDVKSSLSQNKIVERKE